jgi:hypothetical protein
VVVASTERLKSQQWQRATRRNFSCCFQQRGRTGADPLALSGLLRFVVAELVAGSGAVPFNRKRFGR